jgi:hypothetical protein
MSQYQVSKLMRDITRDKELARLCRTEFSAISGNYNLEETEQDAIRNWNVRALFDMGINPLLLLTSSMAMGTDIRAYTAALRGKL